MPRNSPDLKLTETATSDAIDPFGPEASYVIPSPVLDMVRSNSAEIDRLERQVKQLQQNNHGIIVGYLCGLGIDLKQSQTNLAIDSGVLTVRTLKPNPVNPSAPIGA